VSSKRPDYKALAVQSRQRPHDVFLGDQESKKEDDLTSLASNDNSSIESNDSDVDEMPSKSLDDLLQKRKNYKRYRGFYIEPEIDVVLDGIKEKYGRGSLSELVNQILKEGLSKRGIL